MVCWFHLRGWVMREISPNVWQLIGFPPNFVNVYLIGDVLIDAATRWAGRRILRQIGDRKLSMLALTHAHPDHQGVAKMICERYRIPLACHAADVPTMQGERPMQPDNSIIRLISLFLTVTDFGGLDVGIPQAMRRSIDFAANSHGIGAG